MPDRSPQFTRALKRRFRESARSCDLSRCRGTFLRFVAAPVAQDAGHLPEGICRDVSPTRSQDHRHRRAAMRIPGRMIRRFQQ